MIAGIRSGKKCSSALIGIEVNGKPVRALGDAGAACSIIHAQLCRDLKLPLYPDKMEARGVTGTPLANIGRTAAKISLGMSEYNQCLHVAENTSQDLILGADFLEKLGDVTYSFKKGIFKVRDQQFPRGITCVLR